MGSDNDGTFFSSGTRLAFSCGGEPERGPLSVAVSSGGIKCDRGGNIELRGGGSAPKGATTTQELL